MPYLLDAASCTIWMCHSSCFGSFFLCNLLQEKKKEVLHRCCSAKQPKALEFSQIVFYVRLSVFLHVFNTVKS